MLPYDRTVEIHAAGVQFAAGDRGPDRRGAVVPGDDSPDARRTGVHFHGHSSAKPGARLDAARRALRVHRVKIDGKPSMLEKLYVNSTEGRSLPKVNYIELFGKDLETGEKRYEKLLPKGHDQAHLSG